MSAISAYFIPAKKVPSGQFKDKVKTALEQLKIIEGYYDEEDESYASTGKIVFEFLSIHDGDKDKLVPEASSSGYGATCPHCSSDIDEEFYDAIDNYYDLESESGKEKDMSLLKLRCPGCKTSSTLETLKFTQPVLFSNQFFQFVDMDQEISSELLDEIKTQLAGDLQVIYERM